MAARESEESVRNSKEMVISSGNTTGANSSTNRNNNNRDTDESMSVQKILKEIKSFAFEHQQKSKETVEDLESSRILLESANSLVDQEAASTLMLLGNCSSNSASTCTDSDLQTATGLLNLHDGSNGCTEGSRKCQTNNGHSSLPEVSALDLGVWLSDIVLPSSIHPLPVNGITQQPCTSTSPIHNNNNKLLSKSNCSTNDEFLLSQTLSSPTKARQLLSEIENGHNSTEFQQFLGSNRPPRPVSAPSVESLQFTRPNFLPIRRQSLDDLRTITTSPNLFKSFFVRRREDSQSETNNQDELKVDVCNQKLPIVDSPDISAEEPTRVFVSDVFQFFFSRRHFDQFRSILEDNYIKPIPMRPRGVGEAVETITVDELEKMLTNNRARKDGFVKCLKLNSYAAGSSNLDSDTKIINRSERLCGELESGIRTRRGENEDIGYVEIDGVQLPSILMEGSQFIRLVDILRLVADREPKYWSNTFLSSNYKRLKSNCERLSLPIYQCSGNDKARLVVVAKSLHHDSQEVILAYDAPKLIAFEKELQSKRVQRGKRPMPFDSQVPVGKRSKFSRDQSPCSSTVSTTIELELLEEDDDNSSLSALTSPQIASRPSSSCNNNVNRLRFSLRPSTPDNCSRGRPFLGRHGIDRRKLAPLLSQLKPLLVVLHQSQSLRLVVAQVNLNGTVEKKGPNGYYQEELFVDKNAQCIRCQFCNRFLSVLEFLSHFHSPGPISNGNLMMVATKKKHNKSGFIAWQKFNKNLFKFGLDEFARVVSSRLCFDQRQLEQLRYQEQQQFQYTQRPKNTEKVQKPIEPLQRLQATVVSSSITRNVSEKSLLIRKFGMTEWQIGRKEDDHRVYMEIYGTVD